MEIKHAGADIGACKRARKQARRLNIISFLSPVGGSAVLQGGIATAVCAQLGEQVRVRALGGTRRLVATGLVSTWRLAETASECADCPASVWFGCARGGIWTGPAASVGP